jgi:PIN like domain
LSVRFYVDADTLGLAKILVTIRPDVTYPGDPGGTVHKKSRPACSIHPKTKDVDWLPIVAKAGWLIITRDQHIRQRRAELAAVRDHGAKLVAIVSGDAKEKLSTFAQLEILMINWRRVDELVDLPGPFAYAISRSAFTKLDLD